jgi:hypothetical protein
VGRHHLVDGDLALGGLDAPVLEKGEHGIAGHPGKDRPSEGRRDHLAPDLDHDVHGPHLVDVLALDPVQPQDLGEALMLGLFSRHEARRVVGARLGPTQPAVHGPDVALLDADLHGRHALGIVGAYRGEDDEVDVRLGRAHAEEGLVGDDGRPDIERRAEGLGYPIALEPDEGHEGAQGQVGIERRDAHADGRVVHALHVLLGPEQPDLPVDAPEGLEPVEDRLGIVRTAAAGSSGMGA